MSCIPLNLHEPWCTYSLLVYQALLAVRVSDAWQEELEVTPYDEWGVIGPQVDSARVSAENAGIPSTYTHAIGKIK